MHVVIIILTILVAVLLIGIVLIQKSKGGGLSSQFGGAGSVMGVRQANSFLEKATWTLVALLAVLSVVSAYTSGGVKPTERLRAVPAAETPAATLPAAGQLGTAPVVVTETEAVETVEVPAEAPAEAPAATPAN